MSFMTLGLRPEILRAVEAAGYTEPTPIQQQAIPLVLQGRDLMATAQTGTGKTAGFTLPLLELLMASRPAVAPESPHRPPQQSGRRKSKRRATYWPIRCLVVTPTRELAAQVLDSIRTYSANLPLRSTMIFGGVGMNPQITALRRGVDIVVATPGRLLDLSNQGHVDLSKVEVLVLDEADRMLDMGFIHDIKKILAMMPKQRQNLLFSATMDASVKRLASSFLHQPETVQVARQNKPAETVEQAIYRVDRDAKTKLLIKLIGDNKWSQVLVFTRTKHRANRVAEKLQRAGITATAIHGNKSQGARTRALADFKSNRVRAMVATDIAARGLDINDLPQVVNFEIPNVPEDYVHRIGRTGRAGSTGRAVSLVSHEEEKMLRDIERLIQAKLPQLQMEGFERGASAAPVQYVHQNRRPAGGKSRGQGGRKPKFGGARRSNSAGNASESSSAGSAKGYRKARPSRGAGAAGGNSASAANGQAGGQAKRNGAKPTRAGRPAVAGGQGGEGAGGAGRPPRRRRRKGPKQYTAAQG